MNGRLDEASFEQGLHVLTNSDKRLAAIVDAHGPPPFWQREPGFPTLIHIILEQQVSLASALATFRRVSTLADPLTPASFYHLSDQQLRESGLSRQKVAYGRALSEALLHGTLDLDELQHLEDREVRRQLMQIKGIGQWTADVYLLIALRRQDAWPVGDLGLIVAVQEVLDLPQRPTADALEELSQPWKPWRAVATRLFWHHYLNTERSNR